MPALIFANIQSVSNPARFAEYQGLAETTVVQYGGKFLGGDTKIEIAYGDWSPMGVKAAEFESLAKAKERYHSPRCCSPDGTEATHQGPNQALNLAWIEPRYTAGVGLYNSLVSNPI